CDRPRRDADDAPRPVRPEDRQQRAAGAHQRPVSDVLAKRADPHPDHLGRPPRSRLPRTVDPRRGDARGGAVILRRPADGYTILHCAAASGVGKPWFRDPQTWTAWRTFLSVLFGLSLDDEGHALYRQCTGRSTMPRDGFTEAWLICGRKAGKSFNLALIA